MRITERVHSDAGYQIEVALAFEIIQVAALAARQDDRVPSVVLKEIILLELHQLFSSVQLVFDGVHAVYDRRLEWECGTHF